MGVQDEYGASKPELVPLQSQEESCKLEVQLKNLRGRTLLLRYLRGGDWLLLSAGTIFALLHGACFPLITLILGYMTDILLSQAEQRCNSTNVTTEFLPEYSEAIDDYEELSIENLLQNTTTGFVNPQQLLEIFSSEPASVSQEEFEDFLSLLSAMLAIFVYIAAFIQPFCWELCSSRRVNRLRQDLFHKLLRQDMSWYDIQKDKDIVTKICRHVDSFQQGTGNKLGMLLQYTVTCTSGLIVALSANWRLTLFILPLFFLCLVVPHLLDKVFIILTSNGYAEAGQIAEEVFSNLQPSDDIDGHGVELNCYREAVHAGQRSTLRKFYILCTFILTVYLITNALMGLALWMNWKLIEMGCLAPGAVATVFFSVIVTILSFNKVLSFAAVIVSAKNSALTIRDIIDCAPPLKRSPSSETREITGKIQFKDVCFSYPTTYKNQMLHNINIEVKPGQSVAFLDVNGREPSSIMDLLLQFYEPSSGKVLFDEMHMYPHNTVAVISFNPQLFNCLSVLDNIQLGLNNVQFNQVVQAAINIGVHGYIPGLDFGYDTPIQDKFAPDLKQRIILARAVIRNPRILVIDDITLPSIMEIHNNRQLIETFHRVMDGRTTIVLSQRLSIIQHANTINVLENGILCESGTHGELIAKGEVFHRWVKKDKPLEDFNGSVLRSFHQNGTDEKHKKTSEFVFEPELMKQKDLPSERRCSMICLNAPEWTWLMIAFFCHFFTGLGLPAFARLFGDIFVPREELPRTSQFWGYMVLAVAAAVGVSFWLQSISRATCTEKLLNRLRIQTFSALLKQAEEKKTDRITLQKTHARLSQELPAIRMVTATRVCEIIGATTSMLAAMVTAFLHGWKMELVLLLVFPTIALANVAKARIQVKHQRQQDKLMKPANKVMEECVQKIRTLRVIGGEETFEKLYAKKLVTPYHASKKQSTIYAVVYALAESGVHVLYAASFKFGFFLIKSELMGLVSVYRIFFALGICIIAMSHILTYTQEWFGAEDKLHQLFRDIKENTEEKKQH